MTNNLAMLVCASEADAKDAKEFLKGRHYPSNRITVEEISLVVSYDAETYHGGGKSDAPTGTWVVIGRK